MSNKAQLDPKAFQGVVDGKEVRLYSLTNKQGAEAHFINQGAKLVSLIVPSRSGSSDTTASRSISIAKKPTSVPSAAAMPIA